MGYWVRTEQTIYSGAGLGAWTSLDISSIVGAQRTACVIGFHSAGFNTTGGIREGGDTYDYLNLNFSTAHGTQVLGARSLEWHIGLVSTNDLGVIEWNVPAGATALTITLEGYWIPSHGDALINVSKTLPIVWGSEDISAIVGANRAFFHARYVDYDGSTWPFATRYKGSAQDYLSAAGYSKGVVNGDPNGAGTVEGVVGITDHGGVYELKSNAINQRLHILMNFAEVTNFTWTDQLIFLGSTVSNAWTSLPTGLTGSALAIIECNFTWVDKSPNLSFRRSGDTRTWELPTAGTVRLSSNYCTLAPPNISAVIIVPTGDDGKVEYFDRIATPPNNSIVEMRLLGYIGADTAAADTLLETWTPDITAPDNNALGAARLIWQYRGDQPRIQAFLDAMLTQLQSIEDVSLDVLTGIWPLTAVGDQLDVLGRIVGQLRGDLDDGEYRVFILGRIFVNHMNGTIQEFYDLLEILGVTEQIHSDEAYPAFYRLDATGCNHGKLMGELVLDAAPAGVDLLWIYNDEDEDISFAFSDTPGADEVNADGGFANLLGTIGGLFSGSSA